MKYKYKKSRKYPKARSGERKLTSLELKRKVRMVAKLLKEKRKLVGMSQAEVARKAGFKISYISWLENSYSKDIELKTLFRVIENGLGKKLRLFIE